MESDTNCREMMFEKVVTPSDVGKLNRLVIPKMHAERHFPAPALAGSGTTKGMLLSFEDACTGRAWRFRYSYWSSSQSYVITKGWSRFVKDKGLLAGDTVSFARDHRIFFIDCRRQKRTNNYNCYLSSCDNYRPLIRALSFSFPHPLQPLPWSNLLLPPPPPPPAVGQLQGINSVRHFHEQVADGGGDRAKRVRLFGVNLDCFTESAAAKETPAGLRLLATSMTREKSPRL